MSCFSSLITCTHAHSVELWRLGSLKHDLKFLFLVVLLMKMERGKTLKSWAKGSCIYREKEFYMKKEREGTLGRHFLSLAPQETQEYTVKNIFSNVDTVGEGEGGWIGRLALAYIHYLQCKAAVYMGSTTLCSVMTSIGGMGMAGREDSEGGDICIHIVEPLCCTAET